MRLASRTNRLLPAVATGRVELPSCIRMKDDAPVGSLRWGDRPESNWHCRGHIPAFYR